MTEEIKEILDCLCLIARNEYVPDELLNDDMCNKLLNYITNLQKENLKLISENEAIKNIKYTVEETIYKSRNEKAVEYNKKIVEKYLKEDDCEYCDGRYNVAKKNLDILEGGDEE